MLRKSVLSLLFYTFIINASFGEIPLYKSRNVRIEDRVNDLFRRMTLEEKIGQLVQVVLKKDVNDSILSDIKNGKVSSYCVIKQNFPTVELRNKLQQKAVNESRLGIPIIFGFDVIHGFKTIFPIPLGASSSWDIELVKKTAKIAAEEAKSAGMDLTFSPMVDVARDPRWGRISEGYGEDILLNLLFGKAMIEGYQQKDSSGFPQIGACLKHFVGYGAVIGGRDYQFTEISERTLREVYLPPFREGIESGAMVVMSAFNDISGIPASANNFTLNKILKGEWRFDGFVLSDWDAVIQLIDHGIVGSKEEAALSAIKSGVDMEMKSDSYWTLIEAVQTNQISIKVIDEAVKRVLKVKFNLGLFENPYVKLNQTISDETKLERRVVARQLAAESMVLLKNNGVLPLATEKTISLLGDWVHSRDVYGWWTGNGDYKDAVTVWDGISSNAPKTMQVLSATETRIKPDAAIVCVGESGNLFGENNCRATLDIPFGVLETVKQLKESGKRVILVIFCGRPLVLTEVEKYADAIVLAWHPGIESGNALADVLFGKVNPCGKLTCSFPKHQGQIPLYYSERTSGRPDMGNYDVLDKEPLYPFGFGLSYANFEYSNLNLSSKTIKKTDELIVTVNITNKGKVSGKEIVQLYVHDKVASVTRPKKELKDFKKIELKPGETKKISFTLRPEQLKLLNKEMQWVIEPGDFDIWVSSSSQTGLKSTFNIE